MFRTSLLFFTLIIFYVFVGARLVQSLPPAPPPRRGTDRLRSPASFFLPASSSSSSSEGGRRSTPLRPARNCDDERVSCIDDCSFLCARGGAFRCVGNVCVAHPRGRTAGNGGAGDGKRRREGGDGDLRCSMGFEVLAGVDERSGAGQWRCLCYDPMLFGGERCEKPAPDFCEHGVLFFGGNEEYRCLCHPPHRLMFDEYKKPHCLEKKFAPFFPRSRRFDDET